MKTISIGKQDFASLREHNCFYIDKTDFIKEWWNSQDDVTLITRPRRFGKTLNMSMVECFFSVKYAKRLDLFEGLSIEKNADLRKLQGTYPVLFLSFAAVKTNTYENARRQICSLIASLYDENMYLLNGDTLNKREKKRFQAVTPEMNDADAVMALQNLCLFLSKYYGKKVIVLLDEYDTPLQESYAYGYWRELTAFTRSLFNATFKTNPYLERAIMTGITRVSKESIFSDLNNLEVITTTSEKYATSFGFTESEVFTALDEAGMSDQCDVVKKWYDGYHFGDADVYCPWDVMCYIDDLQKNSNAEPDEYWKDTSDNAIIRSFIDYAGTSITKKMETLMSGGYIVQRVDENLTYDYLHSSEENLWSMMYLTGYLTRVRDGEINEALPDNMVALKIPNLEIKQIFETEVAEWFEESASKWNKNALFEAVWRGDCERITGEVSTLLRRTISYHDYGEDFYHAFLSGIFAGAGYQVDSNKEHGEGRSDVVVCDTINGRVAIFEAKRAMTLGDLESACDKALRQIDQRMYAKDFEDEYDSDHIHCYGIAFYKKRCFVKKKD